MIYFVETPKSSLGRDELPEMGLGYLLDGAKSIHQVAASSKTPSGAAGILLCADRFKVGLLTLDAGWDQLPGRPVPTWVAVGDAKPESLKRDQLVSGRQLADASGGVWTLPVARRVGSDLVDTPALPRHRRLGTDGNLTDGAVKRELAWLWEASREPWDSLTQLYSDEVENGRAVDLSDKQVLAWLSPFVEANYVIGSQEMALLPTFDSDGCDPLSWLSACTGFAEWLARKAMMEEQKKTGAEASPCEVSGSTT